MSIRRRSTIGVKAVRKFLDEPAPRKVRQYGEDFYLEDELPLYRMVRGHLEQFGSLPTVGTVEALHRLPPSQQEPVGYYEAELRRRKAFTQFGAHWGDLKDSVGQRDVDSCAAHLREMLAGVTSLIQPNQFSTLAEVTEHVVSDYAYARDHPGLRGVTFGWDTLDSYTLGAQGGDLVVVAGRTGMGKTSVMIQLAHAAHMAGHSALFTSLEMSLGAIARRWIGIHTGINPRFVRAGQLSTRAEQRLVEECQGIMEQGAPVYFQSGDFQKNVASIEALMEEFDTDVVYVDAAYLLSPEGRSKGYVSRWESIASVIQELKRLALKHDKPIILSVQLNRNVKKGTTRDLDTADIAGADTIPQDASIVLGLRQGPAPYTETSRWVQIVKNRDGEEGKFLINHRFSPVDFSEAPELGDVGNVDVDVSWMQNGL
jgi:replicative DNA helicase